MRKISGKISKATFSLLWVPDYGNIEGKARANELAQETTRNNQAVRALALTVLVSTAYDYSTRVRRRKGRCGKVEGYTWLFRPQTLNVKLILESLSTSI